MDPFGILGLPRSYAVDVPALEIRHRELSRALHPDKFVGAGPSERRAALTKAVEVNEAWRIVRDPILRAEALLKLFGVDVGEGAADARTVDPEFLMEMLEQREALSDAKKAHDLEAVRKMAKTIEERMRSVEGALAEGFATQNHEPLLGKVGEMRFCRRFLDEVSAIEDEWAA